MRCIGNKVHLIPRSMTSMNVSDLVFVHRCLKEKPNKPVNYLHSDIKMNIYYEDKYQTFIARCVIAKRLRKLDH